MPDPVELLIASLRDVLGITDVLRGQDSIRRNLRGIHHDLRSLMSQATELTDTVSAVLGEQSEIMATLDDLASRVAGDPELSAAVTDAQSKLRQAVAELHAKVQAVDPSPADPADPSV